MKSIPVQVWLTNGETLVQVHGTSVADEEYAKPNYVVQHGDKPSTYYKEQGYLLLGSYSIHGVIEPTREELLTQTINAMREQVQKVRADAEVQANALTQRINDLLMISHDVGEDHV